MGLSTGGFGEDVKSQPAFHHSYARNLKHRFSACRHPSGKTAAAVISRLSSRKNDSI